MTSNFVVLPAPKGDFVELARTQSGRLFRKQILPALGSEFVHPSNPKRKIVVDEALALSLKKNFDAGMADIVQVPLVDDGNRHVEDPLRNVGEVVDVTYDDSGVYVTIDARKHAEDMGKTLIGASAMFHLDYTDTKTGAKVGPTLLHTAITNRPYITNLKGFEEIVAASADTSEVPEFWAPAGETSQEAEQDMDLDELLATLKTEHNIDVLDLQERAESGKKELVSALSAVLREAGAVSLSAADDAEVDIKDVADAFIALSAEKVALSEQVATLTSEADALKLSKAEAEVDALVTEGRILPRQRETMLRLSVEDRDTFDALLPEQPIVALSEVGAQTHEAPKSETLDAEIERLTTLANKR